MDVSYATMEAMGILVQRLGQNARRLEKALAETMNASAEWKRIADELKAERNAEREQHTAIKQALGVQDAKEAGKVLGMVEGEGLRAAAQRVVKERAALRAECDDLRRVFSLVHGSLGIQQGEHIGNAIDALKKERDELATRLRQSIARGDFADAAELETERERHRQTAAVPQSVDVPRTHPVPCDPPEATHITPDGKATAQAAVTPQPGDVVRLVRVPTVKDCSAFQDSEQLRLISTQVNTMGKVVGTELCEACACVVDDTGTIKAWPLSCVEVVKGGDK